MSKLPKANSNPKFQAAMASKVSEEVIRVAETLRTLQEHLQCVICLETLRDPVSTRCGHTFCQACIDRIVKGKGAVCPLCKTRVNRRGIVGNEKIRNVVKVFHTMVSSAQKDIAELGFEDAILPKDCKSSSRKSPSSFGRYNVDPPPTSGKSKSGSTRRSKVESWLMGMHSPTSTQESAKSVPSTNSTNGDSDSEMVSVSQIHPDQLTSYVDVTGKSKPLSAHIEDYGEAEQVKINKKPNKKIGRKSLASKKVAPLNVKSKQQSLKGFMTPTPTSSKTGSAVTDNGLNVPDPVLVILDLEKENTAGILPTRSPGWSRVQKMKKEFQHQSKVLQSTNPMGNLSPVPSIEDSSDEQPCLHLSLDSPVLKKKAKVNEIVNSLASEIELIERSSLRIAKQSNKELLTAPKETKKSNLNCATVKDAVFMRRDSSLVQFIKLGPIVPRKCARVPIYLKGSLENLSCDMVSKAPYRSFCNAQTQTEPESLSNAQGTTITSVADPRTNSPTHCFKSAPFRRSEGAYSECDMDAETVLFTQTLGSAGRPSLRAASPLPSPEKESAPFGSRTTENLFPDDKAQSQHSNSITFSQNVASPEKLDHSFIAGEAEQSQPSRSIIHPPNSEKTTDFETTSLCIPQVDLDDSCSSITQNRSLKRSRIYHSLSDSSDSEVEVPKKQTKKHKKNKVPLLSDDEDSCTNDLDISVVDTSKIMANIEAQLNDAERMQSSDWLDRNEKKGAEQTNEVSCNLETFDERLDALSDTSRTQVDSDGEIEFINPTPQKQTSLISRQTTQSDDIVPSSQPSNTDAVTASVLLQNALAELPTKDSFDHVDQLSPPKVDQEITCPESPVEKALSIPQASEPLLFSEAADASATLKTPTNQKPLFVCSSLPPSSVAQVEKLANIVGADFSSKLTPETTHLIVRVDERNKADKTLKYLLAVADGKWVVSFSWVQKCLEAKKLLPEEPYEAFDASGEPGPQRSREAHSVGRKLFGGFEFCCVGDFPDLSKAQMKDLLILCGAAIVSHPTDFSFQEHIIPVSLAQWDESKEAEYNSWLDKYSTPLVQHEWVLDCIGKFSVASFSSMLLCDVSDEYLTSMGIPSYLFELTESDQM